VTTEQWRQEFPLLSQGVYLLSNSLGAVPRRVEARVTRYTEELFTLGESAWSIWCPWVLEAGDRVGRLVGAPPGTVTLDSSASTFLHRIASCFDFSGERRRVVTSSLDFPTAGYAWAGWSRFGAERIVVETQDGIRVPLGALLSAIDERTLVVSVSLATYCSGALIDLGPVVQRAHEGAPRTRGRRLSQVPGRRAGRRGSECEGLLLLLPAHQRPSARAPLLQHSRRDRPVHGRPRLRVPLLVCPRLERAGSDPAPWEVGHESQ